MKSHLKECKFELEVDKTIGITICLAGFVIQCTLLITTRIQSASSPFSLLPLLHRTFLFSQNLTTLLQVDLNHGNTSRNEYIIP
jgi:hypothetical protein